MDEKTIEEFKKKAEKLYPEMTEEHRDKFIKEIDEELLDKE